MLLCISEEELVPLSAVYSRVRDAVDFRKGWRFFWNTVLDTKDCISSCLVWFSSKQNFLRDSSVFSTVQCVLSLREGGNVEEEREH